MNERYAAEPASCDSALELKHLLEKFGPETGRYLADYPSKGWEKLVLDHITNWKDIEQEKSKVVLRRAKESRKLIRNTKWIYCKQESWIRNIENTQAADYRFDGVVVSRSNAGQYSSLDELDLPPTAEECVLARATEYARVAHEFIRMSPELHFIDAYLNPCSADRRNVLSEMFRVASVGRCQFIGVWMRESSLNTMFNAACDAMTGIARHANFTRPCKLFMYAFNDAGASTKVHNRYLLGTLGAIRFEHGFQELTGKRTADVAPVSKSIHDKLVSLYIDGENDLKIEKCEIKLF